MNFGRMPIEYGHLPFGHTDGDMYVFFPAANVISRERYPFGQPAIPSSTIRPEVGSAGSKKRTLSC